MLVLVTSRPDSGSIPETKHRFRHVGFIHEGRAQVDHLGVGFVAEVQIERASLPCTAFSRPTLKRYIG